jgi:hypothetical protein
MNAEQSEAVRAIFLSEWVKAGAPDDVQDLAWGIVRMGVAASSGIEFSVGRVIALVLSCTPRHQIKPCPTCAGWEGQKADPSCGTCRGKGFVASGRGV